MTKLGEIERQVPVSAMGDSVGQDGQGDQVLMRLPHLKVQSLSQKFKCSSYVRSEAEVGKFVEARIIL